MLLRGLVALRAGQQRMGRDGLGAGDLAVASAALFRGPSRFGRVGVVAADARFGRVVRRRVDLRKARRPRRVVCVAQKAIRALAGNLRPDARRRIRMGRAGSVTHLASEARVPVLSVVLSYVVVAHGARFAPRVLDLARRDAVNRGGPVVPVRPECRRNQKVAGRYKRRDQ